jgi:hypothetical protein
VSNTITNAFVQQWDDTIRLQAQQKVSRLEAAATSRGEITGSSFTANRIAPLSNTPQKVVRHQDTVWDEVTHSTRVALMQDFYQALPVDRNDVPKVLVNPTSGTYMSSLLAAWNRRKDNLIYNALIGNATDNAGALIALTSGQKIANGGTGFTKAKIIQARALFRKNEADENNDEQLFCIYNYRAMQDVMSDTQLTSADFLSVQMLQNGDVGRKWLGVNWVPFEGITLNGSIFQLCMWAKSGVHVGQGFVEGKSQTRGDKQDTMQVSMAGSYAAVRVEEEKVVQIDYV